MVTHGPPECASGEQQQQQLQPPSPHLRPVALLFWHRREWAPLHIDSIQLAYHQTTKPTHFISAACRHGNPYVGANEPITLPPQLPPTIHTILHIRMSIPSSPHNPYNQLIHIYLCIYDTNALSHHHNACSHIFLIPH